MKNLEQLAKDILDKKVYISYPRCVGKNTFYQELREAIEKEQNRRQNENYTTRTTDKEERRKSNFDY